MSYDATRAIINAYPGVPSDSAIISGFGFYVGVTGDVSIMPSYQESKTTPVPVLFKAVPAGTLIRDIVFCQLLATGTTATDIVILGPV